MHQAFHIQINLQTYAVPRYVYNIAYKMYGQSL